jgi:G protein-coupled receptor GPR1
MLRRGPPQAEATARPNTPSSQNVLSGDVDTSDMAIARSRDKIRRQVRLVFVYPLVYLAYWIFPFCLQIIVYTGHFNKQAPFAVTILSTISLCVAGTVDSTLFMTLEKPWRHVRAGFWKSLACGLHISSGSARVFQGRSHQEMIVDAATARTRRQEEVVQERMERQEDIRGTSLRKWKRSGGANWWAAADDVDEEGHRGGDEKANLGREIGGEEGREATEPGWRSTQPSSIQPD